MCYTMLMLLNYIKQVDKSLSVPGKSFLSAPILSKNSPRVLLAYIEVVLFAAPKKEFQVAHLSQDFLIALGK